MKIPTLLIAAAAAALAQSGRHNVTVAHDPSRSQGEFAAAMAADEQRLISTLPDGTRLTLFTAGLRVRRIFEGDLNSLRRGEALRQLQAVRPVEPNTDLGAALDEMLRSLAGADGERTAIFFTDAKNRPGPESPGRSRSFESILNAATIPAGARIVVRVYGGEALNVIRPEVVVVRDTPHWTSLLRLEKKPEPPPPPPPFWSKWRFAIVSAIFVVLLASRFVWRRLTRLNDVSGPVPPLAEPAPQPPRIMTRFRVQAAAGSLDLEPGSRDSAIIGDNPIADLPLDGAEGSWIQLRLPSGGRHRGPTLLNAGAAPIFVGARRLPSRASLELPSQYVEARLGRELLQIYPETLVLDEGENQ